ncbi:hypothetical protein HK102_013394 [Quaeritorhiza haematococci]|nr:hypothetical protein HK102_013394 [Quaeritorhiza haematococci]
MTTVSDAMLMPPPPPRAPAQVQGPYKFTFDDSTRDIAVPASATRTVLGSKVLNAGVPNEEQQDEQHRNNLGSTTPTSISLQTTTAKKPSKITPTRLNQPPIREPIHPKKENTNPKVRFSAKSTSTKTKLLPSPRPDWDNDFIVKRVDSSSKAIKSNANLKSNKLGTPVSAAAARKRDVFGTSPATPRYVQGEVNQLRGRPKFSRPGASGSQKLGDVHSDKPTNSFQRRLQESLHEQDDCCGFAGANRKPIAEPSPVNVDDDEFPGGSVDHDTRVTLRALQDLLKTETHHLTLLRSELESERKKLMGLDLDLQLKADRIASLVEMIFLERSLVKSEATRLEIEVDAKKRELELLDLLSKEREERQKLTKELEAARTSIQRSSFHRLMNAHPEEDATSVSEPISAGVDPSGEEYFEVKVNDELMKMEKLTISSI